MKILTSYILKRFVAVFSVVMLGFTASYVVVVLIGEMHTLLSNNAHITLIVLFFAYKLPLIIYHVMPMSVLISAFLVYNSFARTNELIAMRAAGISSKSTCVSVLLMGALCSVFLFFLGEFVVPGSIKKSTYVMEVLIKGKKHTSSFQLDQTWFKSGRNIYGIKTFDPKTRVLQGVIILTFDKEFNLVQRIDARSAVWENNRWVFEKALKSKFQKGRMVETKKVQDITFEVPESPEDFVKVKDVGEQLTFSELRRFTKRLRVEGYDASRYIVDMHARIAFPFICLIMTIIAVPLGIRMRRAGGMVAGIGLSMVIALSYWVVNAFSVSLGHVLILPPVVAAWFASIVFFSVGGVLMSTVER